jgi:glyoxylase-like metal-dependent hydrolase (beta-lactamase superfamily II)
MLKIAMFIACMAASALALAQGGVTMAPGGEKHWPVVQEGKTVKISPHVYIIPDGLVPQVPNVGIVVGSKATMVIDPGLGFLSGQSIAREVAKVSRNSVVYVVNTHFHPEHTTGDVAFPTAKVIRATAQQQDVDEMGMKWVATFASRSPAMAEILKDASFRKADELFDSEKTMDLGGVRVRLIRLGPGHTRGDTVFFVEGENVLFSGDLAMHNIFPAFATPQSSARTWLTSLDALDKLNAKQVIGAHGLKTDASVIEAYRGILKTLQTRAGELKKQGVSADDAGKQLADEFKAKYPGWEQPVRLIPATAVVYKELP